MIYSKIKFEYKDKWTNGKIYDVYFEINNEKYVIEMDGAQHYGLSNGSSWIAYKTNQKMTKRRIY